MNDIAALKLYTRVARLGSFSTAARESGVSLRGALLYEVATGRTKVVVPPAPLRA